MTTQDWGDGWTTELDGNQVLLYEGETLRGVHSWNVNPVTVVSVDKVTYEVAVELPDD